MKNSLTNKNEQEEKDGEENNDGGCASAETLNTSERCPICLNFLTLEVGFPEDCCHAFCVSCILKWSETSTSCPVDRKPFQAIYTTNTVGSWTKICVKERRPREYCTKGKLCFRIREIAEETSAIATSHKETKCMDYKEKPDMKIMSLNCPNCFTGDIATCPFNLSETASSFNRAEQEDSELCLIRHKREALKHLRIPLGADGIQWDSTLPAEILIHPPYSLDEFILPLSPISLRSNDYSHRMCAHTGPQEGTEKKQAASGTSTSRGTRKKSVQSSTRRRSTRNSKSDAHNVQSSPKSSSSDHDTPGNSTTTTTSNTSSDHPGKPPAKQRKKATKKGSQTRKRLRSATQPQEDSKNNDDSESEQEKKCKMSEDDLVESELYKINQSPNSSNEKQFQHADISSPLKHSEEEHVLESSPAHNVESADKERSPSPDLHNKHEFHMEHSSPSPVFKNGQTDLEDSQTDFPKSVSEPGAMGAAEAKLDVEEKHSENLNVSDGENSSSSLESTKHIISEHTDSPPSCDKVTEEDVEEDVEESVSLPSPCSEIKPTRQHLQDLSSSEETNVNAENHLHTGQVDPHSNESNFENMESSSTQSTPPLELVKQDDLDYTPTSPNALKEKGIPQPQNVQQLGLDDSLKTMQRQEEQEKVLEVNLQTSKPEESIVEQDVKTSLSSELDCKLDSDCPKNSPLTEQSLASSNSAAEGLSDIAEIQGNRVGKEDMESSLLGNGKIQDINEKSDTNENDHSKVFSEDNIEPVAMECDSACSDHNDSEVEQSVDITPTTKTESDTLTVNKIPESPPKQSLPPSDTNKKELRTRKSRFHSPSTTWSPSKNDKERQRSLSRSKVSDSPIKPKSRSRSREKDADRSHGSQWKGRSRDRHHRRHSRSRSRHSRSRSKHSRSRSRHSRSKSRSKSGSRTRHRNKSVTTDRNEKEKDGGSPPRKDRRANEKDGSSPPRKDRRANEKDCGSPPRKDRRANEKDCLSPPRKDGRSSEKDFCSPPWKDGRSSEKDFSSPPWKDRRSNEKDCRSPPRKDGLSSEKDFSSPPWKDRRSNEKDCSSPPRKDRRSSEKDFSSPPWKDRRSNENWRSPRGSEKFRRNEHDRNENFRNEIHDARDSAETYTDNKNDYPDWVMEKMKSEDRGRGDTWMRGEFRGRGDRGWGDSRGRGDRARGRGDFRGRGDNRGRGDRGRGTRGRGSHWEDGQYGSGDSWNRNVNMDWNSPRSRGGLGRGGFRGGFNFGDQNESWNNRPPYSGNFNTPGQESSRFPESKNKPKYDDPFDSPADRSGWSSASSWAVRKTLPADVQNYYSKRGRNSTGSQGIWPRPEESQDQDQATKEQASQPTESTPVPVNIVHTQMNVVQQQIAPPPPQPINMFPYPVGVHPPMVNIQHNPYNLHPQLPIHLHPALPLVQVSAPSSVPQGLPPPPPPPPPSQQISYITPQQDGKPLQGNPGATYVSNNVNAPLLPAPAAVQGSVGVILGTVSGSVATSGHSKNLHASVKSATRKESVTVEASADSSKKEKKIQIQERAAQVVKGAIKQYYQNKDITKDEYKEIVKKAVDKVCHSKSGEVDSAKVANLVKAYVDKYKHSRKKGPDDKL